MTYRTGTEAEWCYLPSCPCDRCEDYRRDNGLSMLYGLGPRPPSDMRPHQWGRQ